MGVWAGSLLGVSAAFGQSYIIQTVAGTTRLKDGAPAASTPLRYPWGAAQDAGGNVYFADYLDNRILMVGADNNIHIVAGTGVAGFAGDGGPALKAKLDGPRALRLDGKGGLYFADYNNSRVRFINLTTGTITTVAGNNLMDNGSGDQRLKPAVSAGLDVPTSHRRGFGVRGQPLYRRTFSNNRIRKWCRL